jgi:hypothetical protein
VETSSDGSLLWSPFCFSVSSTPFYLATNQARPHKRRPAGRPIRRTARINRCAPALLYPLCVGLMERVSR